MSVSDRIKNQKQDFSESELKIANFILEHPKEVLELTAQQLADKANSSAASVIRMTKRIKVESYPKLKILISSELANDKLKVNDSDIEKNEKLEVIKEKLLSRSLKSITETTEILSDDDLEKIISEIHKAKSIIAFGVGASFLSAENIAQKWNRIGINSTAENDLNMLIPKLVEAKNMKRVLWVISNSGNSKEAVSAAKIARDLGIKVITLTKFGSNALEKFASFTINTSETYESKQRSSATSSVMSQFMAVNVVFYYYISKHFDETHDYIEKSSDLINKYKSEY